ncbi:MAG: phosphatase PAP2 family protein [Methylobacter sp.]
MTGLDLWIARHFYDVELHRWPYQDSLLAETVFHLGGRYLTYVCVIALLICLFATFRPFSRFYPYRRQMFFLLVASLSGPAIIALFKSVTHIYCPWSLAVFDGNRPYVRLFDSLPGDLPVGHCFPAAHAGSGFAFVSLYFFLMLVNPKYRWLGLCWGMLLGFAFGASQQVRGAHFFSHDLFALAVCWFSSVLFFILFFRKQFA